MDPPANTKLLSSKGRRLKKGCVDPPVRRNMEERKARPSDRCNNEAMLSATRRQFPINKSTYQESSPSKKRRIKAMPSDSYIPSSSMPSQVSLSVSSGQTLTQGETREKAETSHQKLCDSSHRKRACDDTLDSCELPMRLSRKKCPPEAASVAAAAETENFTFAEGSQSNLTDSDESADKSISHPPMIELGQKVCVEKPNGRFFGRLVVKPCSKARFVLCKVPGKDIFERFQVLVQYDPSVVGREIYDNSQEFVPVKDIKHPDSTTRRKTAGKNSTDIKTEKLVQNIIFSSNRSMASLRDHMSSGLRDFPTNTGFSSIFQDKTRASSSDLECLTVPWETPYVPGVSNPTLFQKKAWTPTEEEFFQDFRNELVAQMQGTRKNPKAPYYLSKRPNSCGTPGYWKAHLERDNIAEVLTHLVPPSLRAKRSNSIAFFNVESGSCQTHHDRDTSVLVVLSGSKEVLIARQNQYFADAKAPDDTYYKLEPFTEMDDADDRYGWEKIIMEPFTALLIPQGDVHCIKSSAGTVAVSVPVERAPA